MTRLSAKIHKWLALALAVPILFWFVSGLFFAAVPIERVRSEHRKAEALVVPVGLDQAAAGLERIAASGAAPADKVELRSLLGRPVALVSRGKARPVLHDLATGRAVSPLSRAAAITIARVDLNVKAEPVAAVLVTVESPEYRGVLPAWKIDFAQAGRSLYVAADTGAVTARRSTLWRVYDFLWSLHIMDFKNHEDFNNPLLVGATSLALIVLLTGIILFPSRLGYTAWRRRRERRIR